MLKAFFDESGIHWDSSVCVVAGYVGKKKPWKQLEAAWKDTLKSYKIHEFHAKHFFAHDEFGNRVGEYKGWSKSKADAFIGTLTSLVQHNPQINPISCCLVKAAWNDLSYGERKFITGGMYKAGKFRTSGAPSKAYFLPFQSCVLNAAHCCQVGQRIHFIFDLNEQLEGFARDLYKLLRGEHSSISVKDRFGPLTFAISKEAAPIQVADLFGYLTSTFCEWRIKGQSAASFPEWHLLNKMMANTRHKENHQFLDKDGLSELLGDLPTSMREGLQLEQKPIQRKRIRP